MNNNNNKRKRGSDSNGLGGPASKQGRKQKEPERVERASSSTYGADHVFLVPVGPTPGPSVPNRKRAETNFEATGTSSAASLRKTTGQELKAKEPTPEQLKYTDQCRKFRQVIASLICDTHDDLRRGRTIEFGETFDNLLRCWKKYPTVYASPYKGLQDSEDEYDLSTEDEIKHFLPIWLHGLSTLLFVKHVKDMRIDIINLLRDFGQYLLQGNPDLTSICVIELMDVLNDLISSEEGNDQSRIIKVNIEIKFPGNISGDDTIVSKLRLLMKLSRAEFNDAIGDFLDVVRNFVPNVLQVDVILKQKLLKMISRLWFQLEIDNKMKLLVCFITPIMPFILSPENISLELSSINLVSTLMAMDLEKDNTFLFSRLDPFYSSVKASGIAMSAQSQSYQLRLRWTVLRLIKKEQFRKLLPGQQKAVIDLYNTTIDEDETLNENVVSQEIETCTRVLDYDSEDHKEMQALLESKIIAETLKTFYRNHNSKAFLETKQREGNVKVIPVFSRQASMCWNNIFGRVESSLQSCISTIEGRGTVVDLNFDHFKVIKNGLSILTMATNMNASLKKCVDETNGESKHSCETKIIANFHFLTDDFLSNWTKLAENYILNGCRNNDIVVAEKGLQLFINGVTLFLNGGFLTPKPSINLITEWVCLIGLPWYHKFRHRIPQSALPSRAFLSEIKPDFLGEISSKTKILCLKALGSKRFVLRKLFVVDIVLHEMETSKCATAVLDMVHKLSWPAKCVPCYKLIQYVLTIINEEHWREDVELRNTLGQALPSLLCLSTNQKEQQAVIQKQENLHLLLDECSHCANKTVCPEQYRIRRNHVCIVARLLLPLLESRCAFVKIALSRIISTARFHSAECNPELVVSFVAVSANAQISLGMQVMSRFQEFFYADNEHALISDSAQKSYRLEGIKSFFDSLCHFSTKHEERGNHFNYSIKILTIFQELSRSCDQQFLVKLMNYVLRQVFLIEQDSNVVNMVAQSLVANIALNSKPPCSSWEVLTKLRYNLAQTIVSLASEHHFGSQALAMERFQSFLGRLVTIGEYRTQNIFIHHYYPALLEHIVPMLHQSRQSGFLIEGMAYFASKPILTVLQDGFHMYYRSLMLDHGQQITMSVFSLMESKYNFDYDFVASNVNQTAVNELLCYLHDRKDAVIKSISSLFPNDTHAGVGKNTSRSEIQEILARHLMGFFVFVDTKMNSRLESVITKARILKSFTAVIDLMGKVRLTSNRTKIYTTLNSLFGLGPLFHGLILDAWKTFALQLDNSVFGQMSAQILAAALVMKETMPIEVDLLIANFVLTKAALTSDYYKELYFVLDFTKNNDVKRAICKSIDTSKSSSWISFVELLVRELNQENSHIRFQAIRKLHETLLKEQDMLSEAILETEHSLASNIVNSLINATRDADYETLSILGECFGALGAIDPYRFRDQADEANKTSLNQCFTTNCPDFALKYLDLLIREFQEAEDTTSFDYCACLIQQVLKHFAVEPTPNNKIWSHLSPSLRTLVEPLLTSKYKVEKEIQKPIVEGPIFRSEHGKTFEQWLSNWLCIMISHVDETSSHSKLFKSSKYMIPRNSRIASFLLPFVTTFAVLGGSESEKTSIVAEITYILQQWIEQDKMKANSQVFVPLRETEADEDSVFEQVDKKTVHDDNVFQFRCTQEVFSVFDHLFRAARRAKREISELSSTQGRTPRAASALTQPCFQEDEALSITNFLSRIPFRMVSQVAFHCEDYQRALLYIELDLKRNPDLIQDYFNYLQQLYVSLTDLDSVLGVSALRKREPCMNEIVLESLAKGQKMTAVRNLECMVSTDSQDLIASSGLLQAYLSLDEPSKAEILIKGCVSKNPGWEVALQDAQMEALWKLRDWKGLQAQLENVYASPTAMLPNFQESTAQSALSEMSTVSKSVSEYSAHVNILRILSSVENGSLEYALNLLRELRVKLMSPVVAAASNISSGYSRTYSTVVQLHILNEIEQMANLLQNIKKVVNFNAKGEVEVLIKRWDNRLKFVLDSLRSKDPILNVRKSLLSSLRKRITNDLSLVQLVDGSIRDCWLTVAKIETSKGNFTRVQNCLLEAKAFKSPQVLVAQSKLLSKKGDKEEAVKMLSSGLNSFFPKLDQWKRNNEIALDGVPVESSDMKALCSKALLHYAKLCDEEQLLDYDMNIKNYKNATVVYNESEKNFFCLAEYYDRLWSGIEDLNKQSEMKMFVVKYYAQSLHYGSKYVYQSLPRLLSIWFDHASVTSRNGGNNNGTAGRSSSSTSPQNRSSTMSQMQQCIRKLMQGVPMYVLLTAFSQIISRVCHENMEVWNLLREMIGNIICTHPHQTLWMIMAVTKSSYEMRKSRCVTIFRSVERKKPELKPLITNYTLLADRLIELCVKEIEKTHTKVSLDRICRSLPKLLQSESFGNVLIPYHSFMKPALPPKGVGHVNHEAFPQKLAYIRSVEDTVDVMHSLVRPKRIRFIGSDGKQYMFLCKAKDDLRKDCKVMEVNSILNWYLRLNSDSRQRNLQVRLYAVTPLNEEHGLLEWVENLGGFRGAVLAILKEKGNPFSMKDIRTAIKSSDPLAVKKTIFVDKMVKRYPPCFSEWFLNNFHDPQAWYNARMRYIRTAAVMSIMGFILGLGDRHGENINLDSSSGDIVHVDFNCLFNKGETFDVPERVPFRLTQNMIEAMGPLGYEGVFRRTCEITMSIIRERKQIFLSILRPFVYDPLVEWDITRSKSATGETTNTLAMEHMKHIENRISGSARNMKKETDTELSVEAQVAYLIDEATSIDNLCRMFIGWTAFF